MKPEEVDVVIYHKDCRDGSGSAFCIYYYRKINHIETPIEYIPLAYLKNANDFDTILEKCRDKNVLICDYSFKKDQTEELLKVCNLLIIDHHKTAEKELESIDDKYKIFDMKHSGAYLTWKWIGETSSDTRFSRVPRLILLIEDRDIWTKKFPEYYREYQEIIIRDLIKHTFFYLQDINSKPYVVGYIESNVFISDIGNAMMKEFPQLDFAVVYHHEGNYTKFSLRSLDNKADVSTVAKIFGGGGHRNAAGCSVYGITNILPFAVIINNPEPNLLITTYEPGISFRWWMKTLLPRFISRKLVGY